MKKHENINYINNVSIPIALYSNKHTVIKNSSKKQINTQKNPINTKKTQKLYILPGTQ